MHKWFYTNNWYSVMFKCNNYIHQAYHYTAISTTVQTITNVLQY